MSEIKNLAGITPVPVNFYPITEADVTRHLQNRILGFNVLVDYARWDGTYGNAYVRMRVCLPAKEFSQSVTAGNDFVSRQLKKDGSDSLFKQEVLDTLEPYRYPKNMQNLLQDPVRMKTLTEKGIDATRLNELITFSKPTFSRDATGDYFCIYLRPESIIQNMLVSTDTGKNEGLVKIVSVKGGLDPRNGVYEPIRWGVQEDLRASAVGANGSVTVDDIFKHII